MKRRWTIALVLVLTASALAGCIGSATSSSDADPSPADDGASDADHEAGNTSEDAGDADEEPEDDDEADDGEGSSEANDGAGNETTPSAVPSSLSFSGCDIQAGVFEIPEPLVADEIPQGFAPTSVVEPAGPTASVVVDPHVCETATSDDFDGPVKDVGWVAYLLAVDPPDQYEDEDVDLYWIPLAGVADSPKVIDVFESWDLTFEEGTVDMTATATPAARQGQLEVQSDTISSTLSTAVSPAAPSEDPDHKARTFVVEDGEVTSIVAPNVSASSELRGAAERLVEPGSDPGEVPFWAAENALTTGLGLHFDAEQIDIQPLDPDAVAG